MEENYNDDLEFEARREKRRKKRRRAAFVRGLTLTVMLLVIVGVSAGGFLLLSESGSLSEVSDSIQHGFQTLKANTWDKIIPAGSDSATEVQTEGQTEAPTEPQTEPVTETERITEAPALDPAPFIAEADRIAAGYDYDGAVAHLKEIPSYESYPELTEAIAGYEATKATCVPVDVTTVSHIFYHSLVNDPARAFSAANLGEFAANGMNAWMTTVDEFDKITQTMYDNGYVYVRMRDLVVETTDENGNKTFAPNTNLLLPPGKKAVVLSIDDLSYYHSYEPAGYPEKLVLDENGNVKCLYTDADGNESVGDYDVVPRLNTFLEAHPDGAYKGARGLIAMTGYNGAFGYRTDEDYELQQNLAEDQRKWLDAHPDFNRQTEIEEATKIADAIKESGWEFASHTWGHLSVASRSLEDLQKDHEKWLKNVGNIVGEVDTIIFAHGNDLGDWRDYSSDNEKYNYFKSQGFDYYCNVDGSTPYWVQIRDSYVRQGRINLDGYMLYQSKTGATTAIDHLFLASQVFDPSRPTPVIANGEA